MTLDEKDQALVNAAKAAFKRQVEELDPRTTMKLQAARRRALDATPTFGWMPWMVASGFAAASVALLAGVMWFSQPVVRPPVSDPEEFELVTADDSLEFYDELEFYRWLAERDQTG